jgi:hypothetical protein
MTRFSLFPWRAPGAFRSGNRCAGRPASIGGLIGRLAQPPSSTAAEQLRCTDEPRSKWLSEEQIKKIFGVEQYAIVKFKVSRTNCYEFYAVTRSGEIIEVYYHPITGKLVKENRL